MGFVNKESGSEIRSARQKKVLERDLSRKEDAAQATASLLAVGSLKIYCLIADGNIALVCQLNVKNIVHIVAF